MIPEISFRKAEIADCLMYYEWRTDNTVMENSCGDSSFSYDDHKKWFSGKIDNEECLMYVILAGKDPAGQVRFDIDGDKAVISISIDKNFRGRSIGSKAIKILSDDLLEARVSKVDAYIKKHNAASLRAFFKAGYILIDDNAPVKGQTVYHLGYSSEK